MEIIIWPNVLATFSKKNQEKLTFFFTEKLPIYIHERSPKIKPVRLARPHLYELKVRVEQNFYRLAYFYEKEQLTIIYITKTLIKKDFDKEVAKFLEREQL